MGRPERRNRRLWLLAATALGIGAGDSFALSWVLGLRYLTLVVIPTALGASMGGSASQNWPPSFRPQGGVRRTPGEGCHP